jgi:hypothetical protein
MSGTRFRMVTTFLKHWLDNGEVIPLTTNAIESAFS